MRTSTWLLTASVWFAAGAAVADDWPQWMGPNRDSVWSEEGIVERFPDAGLKVAWRAPIGLGYSGPAVAEGRVYVTDYVLRSGDITNNAGIRDQLEGTERVICLDADSGDVIWQHEYDRPYALSYPSGPRATPLVNDGKVYALGAEGNLTCLDAAEGTIVWSKDLAEQYQTESPIWGFAAHPLIVGDLLYCIVGGEGSVTVALDKNTGKEVWRALSAGSPGYCPPTMIEHGGKQQLLIWHTEALNSLDPRTGEVSWSILIRAGYGMSIAAPRKQGDFVFASGVGNACMLVKLAGDKPDAEVVWRGRPKQAVYSSHSTPFVEGNTIYGNDGSTGALVGVRLDDGERLWQTMEPTSRTDRRANYGTAFIVKHQDRFFLFSETGDLILARLSPEGYEEISRFHVLDPTNTAYGRDVVWSHPAFANRHLFARNDKELVCVSLAADQ